MEATGSLPCSHEVATTSYPSQINPVNSIQSYFLNIHFNIILPSASGSLKWSFTFTFPYQNTVCISLLPCVYHICHPFHDSWFNHPNNIQWGVQIMKLLIMQFSLVSGNFLPLKHKYLPQHPHLHSSLIITHKVSHPHEHQPKLWFCI